MGGLYARSSMTIGIEGEGTEDGEAIITGVGVAIITGDGDAIITGEGLRGFGEEMGEWLTWRRSNAPGGESLEGVRFGIGTSIGTGDDDEDDIDIEDDIEDPAELGAGETAVVL